MLFDGSEYCFKDEYGGNRTKINLEEGVSWRECLYCNDYLSVERYALTYARSIRPIPNHKFWGPADLEVKIPPVRRQPGRPRNNRIRGADEGESTKKQRFCNRCGDPGHNAKSCKGPVRTKPHVERPPRPPPKSWGGRPKVDGSRSDQFKKIKMAEEAATVRGEDRSALTSGRGRGGRGNRGRGRGRKDPSGP